VLTLLSLWFLLLQNSFTVRQSSRNRGASDSMRGLQAAATGLNAREKL